MDIIATRRPGLRILISGSILVFGMLFCSCQSKEEAMQEKRNQIEMDEFRKLSEKLNADIKYCKTAVYKLSIKNAETLDPKRKGEIVTEIKRYAKRVKRDKEQLEEIKMKMLQLQGQGAR
jgi:hypothetical protein